MTTILVVGDPHFKINNVKETKLMVEAIVSLAEERKPTIIVILGDVLDRHESVHVTPLTNATNFMARLIDIAPLYILIGNHDRPNNSSYLTGEHPFTAVKHWKNTTVVENTFVTNIGDLPIMFVPYVPPGRFQEAIDTVEWNDPVIIFAHQEFKNAKMGAILSTKGDDWAIEKPLVVSGHIHDYDQLQDNIIYTGTPIQHAFGDRSDKTISWFELDAKGEVVKNERIDLGLPKKKMVYLTPEKIISYEVPPNTQVKLVIKGTTAELKTISKMEKIKTWIKEGIKVVFKDVTAKTDSLVSRPKQYRSYAEELYNNCGELKHIYEELFGRTLPSN
jgi:DNA repair exonuclease SbcCD nuclease subunit